MPYLRVMFDDQEIERRDIDGPVVIGRWAGCDLAVRDILLSRRHCRIFPSGDQWQVEDLLSKNGTMLNNQRLAEAASAMKFGDVLVLGRLRVLLCKGWLADTGLTPLRAPAPRPADPTESMNGTCVGFSLLEPGDPGTVPELANAPLPRPEPKRPMAYERENIDSLLTAIASSSWDSIYSQARKPRPALVAAALVERTGPKLRPRSPLDASLPKPSRVIRRPTRHRPRAVRAGLMWMVLIGILLTKICLDVRTPAAASPPILRDAPAAVSVVPPPQPDINTALLLQAATVTLPFLL